MAQPIRKLRNHRQIAKAIIKPEPNIGAENLLPLLRHTLPEITIQQSSASYRWDSFHSYQPTLYSTSKSNLYSDFITIGRCNGVFFIIRYLSNIGENILNRIMTCIIFVVALISCTTTKSKELENDHIHIDKKAQDLMKRENVQGLALAIIDKGKVVHVSAYGYRNVEKKLPLTVDTIMYGASFTKTAFAYMVLQLVEEGRLDLDASVEKLLPKPLADYAEGDDDYSDLKGDDRWKKLTPRIILTHSTGFANFRWLESNKRLQFHSNPGSRYGYSAEGFYILQLILEKGLGLDVGKEMQTRIFDRFGMKNTSMIWREDFAKNLADGYGLDGNMQPHDDRSSVSAAGSMDTSIADQAQLWSAIVRGEGLDTASRIEMVRPQLAITSPYQFPTLTTEIKSSNKEINLSSGLGLVTFQDSNGLAWFKGGHNPWTGNLVICLENKKKCVVMLSNDVRAERIYPDLARIILGDIKMPWSWEYHYE